MDAEEIERVLSPSRLAAYGPGLDLETRVRIHAWNGRMASVMLPTVAALEVALRNNAHAEIGSYFQGEGWLLDSLAKDFKGRFSIIGDRDRRYLEDAAGHARSRLRRDAKLTDSDVIAASSFSLWTSLVSRFYADSLWSDVGQAKRLYRVFPHVPSGIRLQIGEVEQDLNRIRRFRNRISHHEPIVKRLDLLEENRRLTYQYLNWISPHLAMLMASGDRYAEVLEDGRQMLGLPANQSP